MKFVINTKCDVCLVLHKMYCKIVWKFCEIWKSYGNWLSDGPNSVRFYLTVWDMACMKPVYAICEQQRFAVCCLDSIIPLLAIAEISRPYLVPSAEQTGLSLTWLKTPKTGFLVPWLNYKFAFHSSFSSAVCRSSLILRSPFLIAKAVLMSTSNSISAKSSLTTLSTDLLPKWSALIQLFHEWEHYQFSPLYNDISVLCKLNNTVVTIWWVPNIKYTCTGSLKLFIGHR